MARTLLNRWLLINYSGYPFTPSSLIPDNGLANLAGALLRGGHEVRVLDYATVSMLGRFTPPGLRRRLLRTWRKACAGDGARPSLLRKLAILVSLQCGEFVRRGVQRRVLTEISRELVDRIRRDAIEAVGFKLWNGDGIAGSVRLARDIKRACPSVRIFGGGPHVDLFMEMMLEQFEVFDAMVYGEGEETIVRLAEEGRDERSYPGIPNLLYRRDGAAARSVQQIVEDLDALPMPAYDPAVYPAMGGDEKIKIVVIDDSRGCLNHCAFCAHPVKSAHNLRTKSISRILREVEALETDFGFHSFRFAGSCTPYRLLNDFAGELIRRKKQYRYTSFAHVRQSADADFRKLRESGCLSLFFGVESGSQPILHKMRKGTQVEQIRAALNGAREAGLAAVAGLIFPAPGDTPETMRETLELLEATRPAGATVTPPIVMPRTDWFKSPGEYGINLGDTRRYTSASFFWKVKFLMPPAFWKKLPFSIDGKPHKQILKATGEMIRRVEALGIETATTDESCLMSARSGLSLAEFRDESRLAFFAGDVERARNLVRRINANI